MKKIRIKQMHNKKLKINKKNNNNKLIKNKTSG